MPTSKNINWKVENITLDRNNPFSHPFITAELSTSVFPKTWSPTELAMDLQDHLNKKSVPEIKKVIFNPPATIVLWSDNTKTVVKCQDGDEYDPEHGLAMAIVKKMYGNTGKYCEIFKKWITFDYIESDYPAIPRDLATKICKDVHAKIFEDFKKAATSPLCVNLAAARTFSKSLAEYAAMVEMGARADKLEKETGWIATANKLPSESGDYLVYDLFTGSSYVYEYDKTNVNDVIYFQRNVSHWMPVPAAPVTKKGE